ncbi:MAG: hypothetical protein ABSG64_02145 [Solirubrobacteraceae bacterium]
MPRAMSDDLAPAEVKNARAVAQKARALSDEHQRAHRDASGADKAVLARGEELKRLAAEASAKFELAKQQARSAASVKRRQETVARDAQLQSRLRAEAQGRREAAAASGPAPRRGYR